MTTTKSDSDGDPKHIDHGWPLMTVPCVYIYIYMKLHYTLSHYMTLMYTTAARSAFDISSG